MDELLDRVMRIERVRACFLFDAYGNVIAERSGELAVEARAALRMLLDGLVRDHTQENRREIGKYKVLVRRLGKTLCGVVAERGVDESSLRMQLNILAIKLNAQGLRPPAPSSSTRLPANAVQALERELVSDVGPLGKVLFEAALKRARTTSDDLSADVARSVTNRLAEEIPESARRSWLARSGAIIEAAAIRLPRPLAPLKRADEVAAPVSRKVSTAQLFGFGRRSA